MTSKDATQKTIHFLRDYADFGSLGHLLTINALQDKISTSENIDTKKVLNVKIYQEFMAALEDLGALCIAIRHRDDGLGLIYNYLTYGQQPRKGKPSPPETSLKAIYKFLAKGDGLTSALLLPSLNDIVKAFPALSKTILPSLYQELDILLTQAGKLYLVEDESLIQAYNKTKHGFVVLSDEYVAQLDKNASLSHEGCWIMADNSAYDFKKDSRHKRIQLFLVEPHLTELLTARIGGIRGAVRVVSELTAYLLEENVITATHYEE